MGNLVIGLGGTGGRVLRDLKAHTSSTDRRSSILFLQIDSIHDYSNDFDYNEFCYIYPDIKNAAGFDGEYGETGRGAAQNRRASRMMFGAHMSDIEHCLNDKIRKLNEETECHPVPNIALNIYIVAHLSGGTGSGSLIDMVMLIKSLYRNAHIIVVGILPTVPPPIGHDVGRYLANAYAALVELNALNNGEFIPTAPTTGNKYACHPVDDTCANLFSLLLFNTGDIANTLFHLMTLPASDSIKPFKDKLAEQSLFTLGFSKLDHPYEEFNRNLSYDGSAERQIWRQLFRDAECKLVVDNAEYMRMACVPYSSDEQKSFAPALKMMNDIIRNGQDIQIDNSTNDRDEISMMSLGYGFPLHSINILPVLRKQYKQLMSADKAHAISMLHIEDSCAELTPLLGEDKNEEKKAPYILLAMAMDILCKDRDMEGNLIWAYKTIGHLPNGTPARGTFYNRLTWLDPTHNYIYEHEVPEFLWECVKRDVDNKISKNKHDSLWTTNIKESLDKIVSKLGTERGFAEITEGAKEAFDIISKANN